MTRPSADVDARDAPRVPNARVSADALPVAPRYRKPPAPGEEPCLLCGGPQVGHHCKLRCLDCGAVRDCSDP